MDQPVASFGDLFKRLGGYAVVAEALGFAHSSAVSEMRRRNSVPVRHWPALIAKARELAIPLDEAELARLHARPADTKQVAA